MPRLPLVPLALVLAIASVGGAPAAGAPSTSAVPSMSARVSPSEPEGAVRVVGTRSAPRVNVHQMRVTTSSGSAPGAAPNATPVAPDDGAVAAAPDGTGRVETAPIDTSAAQTVGVTWLQGEDVASLRPQVRTKTRGHWSAWEDLPPSDGVPDEGTTEAGRTRAGTDPMWIGGADAVQIGFASGRAPAASDVKVALVGSEPAAQTTAPAVFARGTAVVRAAVATTDAVGTTVAGVVASAVAPPTIITRDQWGAAPAVCTPAVASTLVGAVVHHTADTNDYTTVAQAEQIIRNDQAYHINVRGWCDIGYNFIVDKWGNIYEGRANSLTQPVIGVHAGGFNTGTLGVAMLGDLSTVVPTPVELDAVARIVGYRLGAYGRNPAGTMTYTTLGGETSRYAAGTTVTLPVVMGHRDVDVTACPGDLGYPALSWVRARSQQVAYAEPLTWALYADLLQRAPDPVGLAGWSGQLLAGAAVSTVADRLAHSTEYVQRRVIDAYAAILHRGPDPTGLAGWTAAIMSGQLQIDDLSAQLLQSTEYYALAGGTPETFVSALYTDVLQRGPSTADVATWVAAIQVSGRWSAAIGVWRSLESASLRVNETYQAFLSRGADPTGLATWAPYWQSHGSDALRAQIVGSDEYMARASQRFWGV